VAKKKKKDQQETGLEPGKDFSPTRLRPIDIQEQEFRTSMRGYKMRDVDEFLDRLTEDYASLAEENKRLREGAPIPVPADASAQADEILRKAREQADAIVRSAQQSALSVQAGGSTSIDPMTAVWPFLTTEREFLRALASMIQEHAEAVKRRTRDLQSGAPSPEPAKAAADTGQAPRKVESAWAATAGTGPPEEDVRGEAVGEEEDVPTIPPSPVDTPASPPTDKGGAEPSLKELFWGEEN
jgi:DivIVA domain-containing protein